MTSDRTLDTSGLTCPIPILKAKKALAEMPRGATLRVLATDPAAPNDFIAFCKATGHELVESLDVGGIYSIVLRRA